MAESQLFSDGVDRLLKAIRPYGGLDRVAFPQNLTETAARRSPGEVLHAWFVRLVNDFCEGHPKRVAIEDNIAVFVRLIWKNKKRLLYANIQTLVVTDDLDDYYLQAGAEATYLRLDFDYTTLGEPFSHPLAHIHVEGALSPRFALDGGNSGNIVVDYLEFLYRHYVPAKWRKWAERVWGREYTPASEDEAEADPFVVIMQAFASSQFDILRDNSAAMGRIKRALRRQKDEVFGLHMDGSDREILEYPAAR